MRTAASVLIVCVLQEIAVSWNDQAASNENQVFVTDLDHTMSDSGLWNAFEKFHVWYVTWKKTWGSCKLTIHIHS